MSAWGQLAALLPAADGGLSSPIGDVTTYIINFGILGIGAICYQFEILVPGKRIKSDAKLYAARIADLQARHDSEMAAQQVIMASLREQLAATDVYNRELVRRQQDDMIPALVRANDLQKEALGLLRRSLDGR